MPPPREHHDDEETPLLQREGSPPPPFPSHSQQQDIEQDGHVEVSQVFVNFDSLPSRFIPSDIALLRLCKSTSLTTYSAHRLYQRRHLQPQTLVPAPKIHERHRHRRHGHPLPPRLLHVHTGHWSNRKMPQHLAIGRHRRNNGLRCHVRHRTHDPRPAVRDLWTAEAVYVLFHHLHDLAGPGGAGTECADTYRGADVRGVLWECGDIKWWWDVVGYVCAVRARWRVRVVPTRSPAGTHHRTFVWWYHR